MSKKIIFSLILLLISGVAHTQNSINYYLENAFENSPLLKQSEFNKQLLQLSLKQDLTKLLKPEIKLETSAFFAPILNHDQGKNRLQLITKDATDYTGYDLALTDGGQYIAQLTAQQALFTKNQQNALSNITAILQQISENQRLLSQHELKNLVQSQFILCLGAWQQQQLARLWAEEIAAQKVILETLVNQAIYKWSDLLLLQIEERNALMRAADFYADYREKLGQLNKICGITDTSFVTLRATQFQLLRDTIATPAFLTQFRLDSLRLTAEQEAYASQYKPQLSLFASTGLNAVYQPALDRFGVGAGLQLTLKLYDGRQLQQQSHIMKIKQQSIQLDKHYLANQRMIEQAQLLIQIRLAGKKISSIKQQLQQYNDLKTLYEQQLRYGEISVMDLKNLMSEMALVQLELAATSTIQQSLINAYNYWIY